MANQEELLRQFVSVTDVDEERARFFLESAEWNLQQAVTTFFEEDGGEDGGGEDGGEDAIVTHPQLERVSSVFQPTSPSVRPKVMTFGDLRSSEMRQTEEESDNEEGQRFFAGGSEHSGQQIVGPPKKKSSDEMVKDLYKGFMEQAGAVPRLAEPSRATMAFVGGGHRLGASPEEESAHVAAERLSSNRQKQDAQHVVLNMWRTGFSVDEGELRNYNDPANANFIQIIRSGDIPPELLERTQGGKVHLDIEDRRHEDYIKPKVTFKAFGGEGQLLGRAAPELVSDPAGAQQDDQATNEAKASASVTLDPSQPITNIQIRLADGGKLVQKFNHTHRVSDARQFVMDARPAMASREFVLMTTFPNKELTDESLTLQDANLLNAVIIQKLK